MPSLLTAQKNGTCKLYISLGLKIQKREKNFYETFDFETCKTKKKKTRKENNYYYYCRHLVHIKCKEFM